MFSVVAVVVVVVVVTVVELLGEISKKIDTMASLYGTLTFELVVAWHRYYWRGVLGRVERELRFVCCIRQAELQL